MPTATLTAEQEAAAIAAGEATARAWCGKFWTTMAVWKSVDESDIAQVARLAALEAAAKHDGKRMPFDRWCGQCAWRRVSAYWHKQRGSLKARLNADAVPLWEQDHDAFVAPEDSPFQAVAKADDRLARRRLAARLLRRAGLTRVQAHAIRLTMLRGMTYPDAANALIGFGMASGKKAVDNAVYRGLQKLRQAAKEEAHENQDDNAEDALRLRTQAGSGRLARRRGHQDGFGREAGGSV